MAFFKKDAADRAADAHLLAAANRAREAAMDQVAALQPMAQGAMAAMQNMDMNAMMAYAQRSQRINQNGVDGAGTLVSVRTVGPGSNGMGATLEFQVAVSSGPGAPRTVTIVQEMMGDLAVYAPGSQIALRINSADPGEAMVWGLVSTAPDAPPTTTATPAGGDDTVARLEQLATLRDSGVISIEEFDEQKARILGGG